MRIPESGEVLATRLNEMALAAAHRLIDESASDGPVLGSAFLMGVCTYLCEYVSEACNATPAELCENLRLSIERDGPFS